MVKLTTEPIDPHLTPGIAPSGAVVVRLGWLYEPVEEVVSRDNMGAGLAPMGPKVTIGLVVSLLY